MHAGLNWSSSPDNRSGRLDGRIFGLFAAMAGRWDTHTCACYEDPCTCCTVCCLPSVAIGQLAHNVLGYPCVLVTLLLFTLFAMHQSVQSYMRDMPFVEDQTDNPVRCYVPLKLAPPLTNMTALLGGDEEGNACLPHPLVTALSSARWILYRHRPPTVIA